jgi:hypothetical protein
MLSEFFRETAPFGAQIDMARSRDIENFGTFYAGSCSGRQQAGKKN